MGLALSNTGLMLPTIPPNDLRQLAPHARGLGFNGLAIDATAPTLRPRELDRSARRDIAALLRRNSLSFAGVDLFIPPNHLTQPVHADRAFDAIAAAIQLAADLAGLVGGSPSGGAGRVVTLALPRPISADVLGSINDRAAAAGVRVADAAWPPLESLRIGAPDAEMALPGVGVALDPAAVMLMPVAGGASVSAAGDPITGVAAVGARLAQARLTDLSSVGRVAPGDPGGRLDVYAYAITLSTLAPGVPVVLDLRAVADHPAALPRVSARWPASLIG